MVLHKCLSCLISMDREKSNKTGFASFLFWALRWFGNPVQEPEDVLRRPVDVNLLIKLEKWRMLY